MVTFIKHPLPIKVVIVKSILVVCLIVFFCSCNNKAIEVVEGPASDLSHIDVILDSATYEAIKNDPFMQTEFGVLNIDTAYYGGKPSYDLYLLGHLSFLHLSLAKGYWKDQEGSGVVVFQTRRPGVIDSVLNSWKQYYHDSLKIYTFKGHDFVLDEVMAWHKTDSLKPKEPVIFANLTSYSADAYKNWGISDSIVDAWLSLKVFMEGWGGDALVNKLFYSLDELHMAVNSVEFIEIRSALLPIGYTESDGTFTHRYNPTIYITTSEDKTRPKYSKVKFRLNSASLEKEIVFSPHATLKLRGDEGWFIFN